MYNDPSLPLVLVFHPVVVPQCKEHHLPRLEQGQHQVAPWIGKAERRIQFEKGHSAPDFTYFGGLLFDALEKYYTWDKAFLTCFAYQSRPSRVACKRQRCLLVQDNFKKRWHKIKKSLIQNHTLRTPRRVWRQVLNYFWPFPWKIE